MGHPVVTVLFGTPCSYSFVLDTLYSRDDQVGTAAVREVLTMLHLDNLEELGDVDEESSEHSGQNVEQDSVGLGLDLPGIGLKLINDEY